MWSGRLSWKGWGPKNRCFQIVILEKTLESPLDCKEINHKGNHSWIFFGRTDAEAEAPIIWPPYLKNWLFRKDPDAWKDWGQEEKGVTMDEMVGQHHQLNGHEFEQILGDSGTHKSLACCSPWSRKSWTWLSNWTTTTNSSLWLWFAWVLMGPQ